MTYTIYLTRHEYGFVEVEANSVEEAKEKAFEAEWAGDVHWADAEVEMSGYEEYKDIEKEYDD